MDNAAGDRERRNKGLCIVQRRVYSVESVPQWYYSAYVLCNQDCRLYSFQTKDRKGQHAIMNGILKRLENFKLKYKYWLT